MRSGALDGADSSGWERRGPVAVLAIAFVLFAWNTWAYDLWAPDEPFFAEGAREMVEDGNWLVPHINGQVDNHKPPLFFWAIAVLSLLGGVGEVTARLPSILAAVGSVWLTMSLARHHAGWRAGLLAGVVLTTTYIFWDKARSSQIDSLLCFLILVSLWAFDSFRAGRLGGRAAGIVFWASAALAVLAKGPVGLLLPLVVALVSLAFDRSLSQWWRFGPLLGPLAFAVVGGAWVAALEIWPVDGYSIVGSLQEHFVERGVSGMHHVQPWWYYSRVLLYSAFPWSFILPGAYLLVWRRRDERALRFFALWGALVVLFFSLSTEKRDLYILPALPAFSILCAVLLDALADRSRSSGPVVSRRWATIPLGAVATLVLMAALAAPFVARSREPDLFGAALVLSVVLLVGGGLLLAAVLRDRLERAVVLAAATMAALLLAASTFAFPAVNDSKSGRRLAVELKSAVEGRDSAGVRLLAVDVGNVIRSLNFYSGGIYLEETDVETLGRMIRAGAAVAVVERGAWLSLPEEASGGASVLYETRLSRRDLLLIATRPPS